ncbi:putative metabolite transport protein, partial [Smittium mucronatum]
MSRDDSINTLGGGALGNANNQKLTLYCIMSGLTVALASFQFGYKISELNNPKDAIMSCDLEKDTSRIMGLPLCLPMSDSTFGLATSIFAIGGLIGSFFGGYCSERFGRKKYLTMNSFFFFLGSILQFFSTNPGMLIGGRFISGIGSGAGVAVAPVYLTEIAPVRSRGFLNCFNQMLIVVGIFIAQVIGYFFRDGSGWRYVMLVGIFTSVANFITMFAVVESPKYLAKRGQMNEAKESLSRLRGTKDVDDEMLSWESSEDQQDELKRVDSGPMESSTNTKVNLISILTMKKYRQGLVLVFCLQTAQQLSG